MTARSNERRRVAITGIGLVTPLGLDTASTWNALLAGENGVGTISAFDAATFPVRIAAEVKGFSADGPSQADKGWKHAARHHRFALAAADEALSDAGIRPLPTDSDRWACVMGGGMMGPEFDDLRDLQRHCAPDGQLDLALFLRCARQVADPRAFVRGLSNAVVSLLTERHAIRGYTAAVHTACSSGGQAVGLGMQLIRRGTADRVLAGGCDSMVNPVWLAAFCLLQALSPDNDSPERASRPFDRTRNGFVLGEGAAVLVLEEWQAARNRGARIYAELIGEGNSLSAYRITDSHPSGDGARQAIERALADARLAPEAIDYVNAHGTSTPMNDRSECAALASVFGSYRPAVSSTKSQMGHLIAAAGAVEAALTSLAVFHSTLPANANWRAADPECDIALVTGAPARSEVRAALSNSFGFGGSNNCLAFASVPE